MSRRSIHLLILLGVVLGLLAWLPTHSAVAQEDGPGFMAARGRASFRLYCATCHGTSGVGDGSVAKFLTVEPSDLTRISERYDEWPTEELYAMIDGRQEVKAHGRREMPIWGDVFQDPMADETPRDEDGEDRANRKIEELIYFLKTIQVTPVE